MLSVSPLISRSSSSRSDSHLGPSRLTGRPALLTRMRSVLGLPKPDLMMQLFLAAGVAGVLRGLGQLENITEDHQVGLPPGGG